MWATAQYYYFNELNERVDADSLGPRKLIESQYPKKVEQQFLFT